uniref:Uncharacterized protein n=1 Tax=Candidatus Kentrum sp. FM TaxID=2126340 RepID=A0A450TUX6_9GAMM|nr:MAG: hypothetical protein BECKFM1743A_GA0114220_106183 [Candidatus Kentron sp. FM]VFJ72791.1 MAG: hypothetical protein BECKFM1743C_GA0114222_106712 [Candidatus Kentron sp. FM]VFK19641.1 MAG: hypothetical protein BECKFM1743B_GA0114221_106342 [Candidatus Kentron sp. FM]
MKTIFITINLFASFLAGLLGALALMLLGHPIARLFQSQNPLINTQNASDVIAVANTYIVFTSFIFIMFTLIVAGLGLWFARWFSITKDKEITENLHTLFDALHANSQLADRFAKKLFEHEEISNKLHKLVQIRVERELEQRTLKSGETLDFSDKLTRDDGQRHDA